MQKMATQPISLLMGLSSPLPNLTRAFSGKLPVGLLYLLLESKDRGAVSCQLPQVGLHVYVWKEEVLQSFQQIVGGHLEDGQWTRLRLPCGPCTCYIAGRIPCHGGS